MKYTTKIFSLLVCSLCTLNSIDQVTSVSNPPTQTIGIISPTTQQLQSINTVSPQTRWRHYRNEGAKRIAIGFGVLGGELTNAAGLVVSSLDARYRYWIFTTGGFFSCFLLGEILSVYLRYNEEPNEQTSLLHKFSCTSIITGIKQLWRERKRLKASQRPQPTWDENV